MNKIACPQVQNDRRRPFYRPSWLSFIEQNPFSNLNDSLTEAIHIWNLEEIRWLLTKLECPQKGMDRRTNLQEGRSEVPNGLLPLQIYGVRRLTSRALF